jgi:hypothetical protein
MFSLYQKSTIIIFLLKCNIKLLLLDLMSHIHTIIHARVGEKNT